MALSHLTRVLVLAGIVTLVNAQGSITEPANHLLAAETGKAPNNYAVTASSDFAVDLYKQLAKENPGKNLFFSPYSMSGALAMTAEGARGETAAQMGRVLRFPKAVRHAGDDAQSIPWNTTLIHAGMAELYKRFNPKPASPQLRDKIAALRKQLDATNQQAKKFDAGRDWEKAQQQAEKSENLAEELNNLLSQVDQYELRVANALWSEKTYDFQPPFLDTIHKFYRAGGLFPLDFKGNPEGSRQQVNTWVEDQTSHRIKDLIPKGSVDDLTRLILTNAIYFKGEWAEPFEEDATKSEDFTVAAGTKVSVPMMQEYGMEKARYGAFNADGSFFDTPEETACGENPESLYPGKGGFLMAELPYKGDDLSMVVLVPQDPKGLPELEKMLTSAKMRTWADKLAGREVNVYLPKFRLDTDYKMKETLQAMGMVRAFNDPRDPKYGAQFNGISVSQNMLYITAVFHKAFVEVNEKGTEAAAATGVEVPAAAAKSITVPFTPTFRANKPFVFAIRDVKTGTILFLGRMTSPKD